MANYNEMVQALARSRERSVAEHKRVTDVQAMIVRALGPEPSVPISSETAHPWISLNRWAENGARNRAQAFSNF